MEKLTGNCDQGQTDEYLKQELKEARKLLPSWDGSTVWVWNYDKELFDITLRLEKESHIGNLTILCTTPIMYHGPFEWSNSRIRITKDDQSFIVSDKDADFYLRAHVVDVAENVEPLNGIFKIDSSDI